MKGVFWNLLIEIVLNGDWSSSLEYKRLNIEGYFPRVSITREKFIFASLYFVSSIFFSNFPRDRYISNFFLTFRKSSLAFLSIFAIFYEFRLFSITKVSIKEDDCLPQTSQVAYKTLSITSSYFPSFLSSKEETKMHSAAINKETETLSCLLKRSVPRIL